jgi:hypothetical protein
MVLTLRMVALSPFAEAREQEQEARRTRSHAVGAGGPDPVGVPGVCAEGSKLESKTARSLPNELLCSLLFLIRAHPCFIRG